MIEKPNHILAETGTLSEKPHLESPGTFRVASS